MLVSVIRTTISRVHPERLELLTAWLAELHSRADEVRESFRGEGVRHEQAYLLHTSEGPVLLYVIEADYHDMARQAYQSSTLPIDLEHKAVLDYALDGPAAAQLLYDVAADAPEPTS